MLTIRGLRVTYPGQPVPAVDGVDLDVADAEVVTVLGPSGSGKSTLLRAVAGLIEPDVGSVTVDGRNLSGVPPHQRGLGLMFQDYALFPHRDVGENVAFGLRMRGDRPAERAIRVAELLDLVGLAGAGRRAVSALSGGERQRVALARALAPSPSLLMLDEPLGALDRALRDRLVDELGTLFRSVGVSVLYVTHDQREGLGLGDRVVIMDRGRVVQEGPPSEVWARPADRFVAGFLGFENLLDVTVTDGVVHAPWGTFARPGAPDGPATLLVRPEAVTIEDVGETADAPDGARLSGLAGEVDEVTFDAGYWRVVVRLGATHLVARVPGFAGRPAPRTGRVTASIDRRQTELLPGGPAAG
jgi:thiamine transport system ATP-binding protein